LLLLLLLLLFVSLDDGDTRGCWVILAVALVVPFMFDAAMVLVMTVDANGIACTPCFDCWGCTPIKKACTIARLALAIALANTTFVLGGILILVLHFSCLKVKLD